MTKQSPRAPSPQYCGCTTFLLIGNTSREAANYILLLSHCPQPHLLWPRACKGTDAVRLPLSKPLFVNLSLLAIRDGSSRPQGSGDWILWNCLMIQLCLEAGCPWIKSRASQKATERASDTVASAVVASSVYFPWLAAELTVPTYSRSCTEPPTQWNLSGTIFQSLAIFTMAPVSRTP